MRNRILALAATGLASAAFAAPGPPTTPTRPASRCPDNPIVHLVRPGRPATVHKLTDLPPANMYLSVYRTVDGCLVPVIAGYGIGATGRRSSASPER